VGEDVERPKFALNFSTSFTFLNEGKGFFRLSHIT